MLGLLKFTLDLFDPAPPPAPPAQQSLLQKPNPSPIFPSLPSAPKASTPNANSGIAVFSRHPEANQQVRLQGRLLDYELLRSRKRTITFAVSAAGLSVRAPLGLSQLKLDEALQEKARWIVRKLEGMQQRQTQMAAQQVIWQDGAVLPYLGRALQVKLTQAVAPGVGVNMGLSAIKKIANNARLISANEQYGHAKTDVQADVKAAAHWVLELALPLNASAEHIREATKAWLINQATQHYTARMNHFAPLLGVQWRSMTLSNAGTRWGSAKADGSIRLHWRLIQFTPDMIDYVVAHELSHLRELNHSPRFWATLASVLPDYKTPEKALKTSTLPVWA